MTDKIKKDPRISKQQRMIIDIFHTSNFLDDKFSKILKKYGITHAQFNIIKNLQAAYPEPLSVKEIKESIMFTNSDVTRMIDRLLAKDLLIRNVCPKNRRKVDIEISKKGSEIIDEIMVENEKHISSIAESRVTEEEALFTSEILRRLRK